MSTDLKDVSSHTDTISVCAHRVTVRWWGGPLEDMIPLLMEDAEERVKEMIPQGYTSGELCYEDDTLRNFKGYWEIQKGD
jgi:uncharacterized membrane protein